MIATHLLRTEIEIDASAERVWGILSDFESYPRWNPFIKSVTGRPEQGARLRILIQPSGAKPMRFSPKVLVAIPGRELRWLGRSVFPGVFDGEHRFLIEPISDERIRFIHSERFTGVLVGLVRSRLDRDTKRGFEEMNQALKERAEASS